MVLNTVELHLDVRVLVLKLEAHEQDSLKERFQICKNKITLSNQFQDYI